jgi:hypothetical protein
MRLTDQFKAAISQNLYASLILCMVIKNLMIERRCLFEGMSSLEKSAKTITNSIRTGSKKADFQTRYLRNRILQFCRYATLLLWFVRFRINSERNESLKYLTRMFGWAISPASTYRVQHNIESGG